MGSFPDPYFLIRSKDFMLTAHYNLVTMQIRIQLKTAFHLKLIWSTFVGNNMKSFNCIQNKIETKSHY